MFEDLILGPHEPLISRRNEDLHESSREMKKIVSSVGEVQFEGKLLQGTRIPIRDGVAVEARHARKYYVHGIPNSQYAQSGAPKVETITPRIESAARLFMNDMGTQIGEGRLKECASYPLVTMLKSDRDPEKFVVSIHFFQDSTTDETRGSLTQATISAEFPRDKMDRLKELIEKDSDNLEIFVQSLLLGFDNQSDKPGMKRVPQKGFYLAGEAQVEELNKHGLGEVGAIKIKTTLEILGRKEYKKGPYGTGVPIV
ncbi:hypothetical protein A2191_01660 [Candidatus Woesebacteria bacterium RIFOXYA1_FULL_38_9]|nr:MAG: hypothetical protein A2191_01660 [Candidatus Woesebacteria bacterium RIFOXYA1_FULL_38_9]